MTVVGGQQYPKAQRKYYEKNKDKVITAACKWQKEHPEQRRLSHKKHRQKNPVKYMLYKAKRRARDKEIEFSIVETDFTNLPTHCPVLGLELIYHGGGSMEDRNASLDRIDNTKGYIKDNVQIISFRANKIKNDATLKELKAITKYMEDSIAA